MLWLCGAGSRITLLAVPPLLPLIRSDLHLSATAVGLLISLPVALFSLAALPDSLLIARLGSVPMLVGGLLMVALGAGLRGNFLSPSLPPLLSTPDDVARTSAAVFTISYAGVVAVALIGGAAWDLLGSPRSAYVSIGLRAIEVVVSAVALRRRHELI